MNHIYAGQSKVLAPLVGGSDLSFRLLSRKYGAQVTFTEMCISEYYLRASDKTVRYKKYTFEFDPTDRPLLLQVAGNRPGPIIEMVNQDMFKGKIDAVDLNCGCPQGFALEKNYGCALLKDPDHLVNLCKEIAQNIPYPLSVKLRLEGNGFSRSTRLIIPDSVEHTIEIMMRLKEVGVRAFTVHGDKRGLADWDAIKKIRETFPDIPIIGNGNVGSHGDFQSMIDHTGVDGVMAGYGALIKPCLFQSEEIDIGQMVRDYLLIAVGHENDWIDIQRHIQWIIKGKSTLIFELSMQKAELFTTKNIPELISFLRGLTPPIHVEWNPEEIPMDRTTYPRQSVSAKDKRKEKKLAEKREKLLQREKFQDKGS
ncbi:dihydrouridine synthase [Planoprotostelium fungivorum]|uniref:Dihydrouridine synthase n=1 Tax=Planoprotostelium fungivorum TaxID=1890364 RepID=A0A2P6N0N8_9EUKA|nr:dihydrouridine synthase [Planoprotostelium fungivorum]